jgi:YidC/Oxa1 family membrane protein insertase
MAQSQKYMMYIVPFFSLTGLYWQYGLVLYWVTTNLWTLGQQFFMFRNWTVESVQPAGATVGAAGSAGSTATATRATQSSPRTPSGTAKTASSATKAASGTAKTASSAAKTASGTARTGAGSGRPGSGAPRAKAGAGSGGTGTGSGGARTGSARGDAAAASASPNGQNGAQKRGLLRLGKQKQEPVPEPEVPVTKVVRQQPVRQARSKRSGKK